MNDDLDLLKGITPPVPSVSARKRAMRDALSAFDAAQKNSDATQGISIRERLNSGANELWRMMMTTQSVKLRGMNGAAIAALLLVPTAGVLTYAYLDHYGGANRQQLAASPTRQDTLARGEPTADPTGGMPQEKRAAENAPELADKRGVTIAGGLENDSPTPASPVEQFEALKAARQPGGSDRSGTALSPDTRGYAGASAEQGAAFSRSRQIAVAPPIVDLPQSVRENHDRVEAFSSNPVKRVAEEPVSTFSIDVDTASYALVRRSLKNGTLPNPDSIRVEELINYFSYDWPVPQSAEQPFKQTVTVMPTPWNKDTLLMHVAIKGFEIPQAKQQPANLVFLVDTSGSMQDADKLPMVKASLKLLIGRMAPYDTISLVTYAGEAGIALEPIKVSEKAKILAAIDQLGAGGSTAGSAGLETAYQLAERAFVKDGVNRIMLATDGDFNVGPSDDASLKRLVEQKRKGGIFLSVLGFGQGNYNDQLMQVLAQNGNGTAAYIDTLAEAEKTLVQEAGSTLFPIAKDVKIQVEFNPSQISEYRLIGYETRALAREDFNNDRVDAGDVGSGHSVTAIYELTPVGSPALSVDSLRYGETGKAVQRAANGSEEIAFIKLRYKKPDGKHSRLISQPVGKKEAISDFSAASDDVRFSLAVAAFGQKLRDGDAVADFSYSDIGRIASAARAEDPFGYRAEFLSLVRLADGLSGGK